MQRQLRNTQACGLSSTWHQISAQGGGQLGQGLVCLLECLLEACSRQSSSENSSTDDQVLHGLLRHDPFPPNRKSIARLRNIASLGRPDTSAKKGPPAP